MGHALDGDLGLGHRLQQGRLGARRGAVDLVRQHHVGEDRPGQELESGVALVEDAGAGDVGRQQVGGALDAPELAADGRGQGSGEHGLAGAGQVLEEHVAAAHQGRGRQPDAAPLAHDHLVDARLQPGQELGRPLGLEGRGGHREAILGSGRQIAALPNSPGGDSYIDAVSYFAIT